MELACSQSRQPRHRCCCGRTAPSPPSHSGPLWPAQSTHRCRLSCSRLGETSTNGARRRPRGAAASAHFFGTSSSRIYKVYSPILGCARPFAPEPNNSKTRMERLHPIPSHEPNTTLLNLAPGVGPLDEHGKRRRASATIDLSGI
ncbi:hypothetical protein C2845_PM04G20270 [Panicum miliaceum]|uniref:Uncharacterized protein n=1 Tax=Panicum miliaceum TaxID=4540 RepID=A0A3L6QSP0_PANMI|nr:hypothetical protein C2845_PM04G20270 [Panicum miliaceum]